MSHVTRHTSHATRHTPHITHHTSHITNSAADSTFALAASSCAPMSPSMRRLRLAKVSPNVPLAVLDALSRSVLPLRAKGDLLWWQLDVNVEQLLKELARAERIKGTPVPLSYS